MFRSYFAFLSFFTSSLIYDRDNIIKNRQEAIIEVNRETHISHKIDHVLLLLYLCVAGRVEMTL